MGFLYFMAVLIFQHLLFVINTCPDMLLRGKGNLELVFPGKALNKGPLHSTKM